MIRTKKRPRITNLDSGHHDKEKETSINIYIRLNLYSTLRSRTLVDCLFQLGIYICISYNRILWITKSLDEALHTLATIKYFYQQIWERFVSPCLQRTLDKNATTNLVQSHFSFLIRRTKVKILIAMVLLMQFTTSRY